MRYKAYVYGFGWISGDSHGNWRFTQDLAKAHIWKTFSGAKRQAKKISNFAEIIECD